MLEILNSQQFLGYKHFLKIQVDKTIREYKKAYEKLNRIPLMLIASVIYSCVESGINMTPAISVRIPTAIMYQR